MKGFIALLIGLFCAFCISGCDSSEAGPNGPISDYIGDNVTKVDITHHVLGRSICWSVENDELDSIREWASKLKYEIFEYEEGLSPGDYNGGEIYDFDISEGDSSGFSYVINGTNDCYLLIEGNWYSVLNPSDPPLTKLRGKKLTIEELKELAKKGQDLLWSDFDQYRDAGVIGSGLFIVAYDIDKNFYLVIGGAGDQEPPLYIRLCSKADEGKHIDIRTESIDDFINSLND
ncbi:MAG: hypothetical protein K2H45_00385 [Acetatifactor sp.]|nr:hypothetical protein [Acetatifactor sp.]